MAQSHTGYIKRLRAGGIELWIPWTKNNQGGDHVELMRVVIATVEGITGMDVGAIFDFHDFLLDQARVDVDGPLFGQQKDPARQLKRKSVAVMDRLTANFGDRSQHIAYYDILSRWGCTSTTRLRSKTHAFRRGGITYLRDRLRERGAHHFDMLHTLLQHGRWKSVSSLNIYLTVDDKRVLELFDGTGNGAKLVSDVVELPPAAATDSDGIETAPPQERGNTRLYRCSVCKEPGHNSRSCPQRSKQAGVPPPPPASRT